MNVIKNVKNVKLTATENEIEKLTNICIQVISRKNNAQLELIRTTLACCKFHFLCKRQ